MNLGRLEGHLEEQADAQTGIAKKERKKKTASIMANPFGFTTLLLL